MCGYSECFTVFLTWIIGFVEGKIKPIPKVNTVGEIIAYYK
jgi:hypothetical protein